MKKAKRICIFLYGFFCFLVMSTLSLELYRDYRMEEPSDSVLPKTSVPSNKNSEYQFVVVEESGNLVIYYTDKKIKYLSTDIPMSNLPQEVQEKVKDGMNFVDEKSLYDFLENYSS